MSNTPKRRDLRSALKKRQTRTTRYRLPLVPYEEARAKQEELTQAGQTIKAAEFLLAREATDDVRAAVESARVAQAKAQEELDECFHDMVFVGLPESEFDALVQLHPPSEEDLAAARGKGEDPPMWHDDSFFPALLEACTQDSQLSADEWVQELAGWEKGEKAELRARLLEANIRSYSTSLRFG